MNIYEELDEYQKLAFDLSMKEEVSIIVGASGTGKSKTIRAIAEALENNDWIVSKIAPTGRAAKRVGGSTIHSWLLPVVEEDIWGNIKILGYNKTSVVNKEAIIIDECSMLDYELWQKISDIFFNETFYGEKKLILVGDPFQLPPIGKGEHVFVNMINKQIYPLSTLKSIHRQKEDNDLIEFSYMVKDNKQISDERVWKNVIGIKMQDVVDVFKTGNQPQVIAPKNGGTNGVVNVNKMLQEAIPNLNTKLFDSLSWNDTSKKWQPNYKIHLNEKIVITKNNQKEDLTNGTIGYVRGIAFSQKQVMTKYGLVNDMTECVQFEEEETKKIYNVELKWMKKNVALGYCITVHKAQGSEWEDIYFVACSDQLSNDNKLIYTALTRARNNAYIILEGFPEKEIPKGELWELNL